MIKLFLVLQVLDLATTLLGFWLGLAEASPVVRLMVRIGPVAGVLLAKIVALGLLGACIWFRRPRVVKWANVWFAALVLWNSMLILASIGGIV